MNEKTFDQNGWMDITKKQPADGERVLTWNNESNEPRIQVFNKLYQCWDTEDGDDFEYELDEATHWQSLPGEPVVSW